MMPRSDPGAPSGLVPSGFFHLRTPLLPVNAFDAVAEGGAGAVRALASLSEVAEAVYLASPGLASRWLQDRDRDPGLGRAVGAYLVRMATRPTPFGLFAGTATGVIGERSDLRVPARSGLRRRSRIDNSVLTAVAESIERDPAARQELVFRPTSSLYRTGDRIRYVEARTSDGVRSHHLVALFDDAALAATLERAAEGATARQLAANLAVGEVSVDEANENIGELVEAGILVSDLQPTVTGGDPIEAMVAALHRSATADTADTAAERLSRAHAVLAGLDAAGLGQPVDGYVAVHHELAELVAGVDRARLVQVDLFKPTAGLSLGAGVAAELGQAVEMLHRITPRLTDGLDRFRDAFETRYGTDRVPLSEALDEEAGIGYEASSHPGAEEAPLLAGLDLGPPPEPERPWTRRDAALLSLLARTLASGSQEMALDDTDLARLDVPDRRPLPAALSVMATLVGTPAQVAGGQHRIVVHGAHGPSGAQMLGRFCEGDAALESEVRAHLTAEEAHRPDAVFAELVHLPEGRIGNVLRRPVLRHWELAYLGRSGAPADRQLAVGDLTVGLEGGRIVLRCARLDDREVLPRLTTAHNTTQRSVGVYKFLAALQFQGIASAVGWEWGPLSGCDFLPRVTAGRLVLARARWRLDRDELRSMARPDGLAELRVTRRLPRLVAVVDGDNELHVDLDRPASVDIALHVLAGRETAALVEVFDGQAELCATGPDGAFCHELVVPFSRAPKASAPPARPRPSTKPRRLAPGSEWLYLKAYCGPATADAVIGHALAPVLVGEQWFFVRYGDPDWHVRVRVTGEPGRLTADVQPRLIAALSPLVRDGRVWRVQLDTYDREVERYGGDQGMALAEEAFCADSAAAAAIVGLLEGDAAADARWRLALLGTHLLLDALGYTIEARAAWARQQRDGFLAEFPGASRLPKQVGRRFRDERQDLDTLLWGDASAHWLAPGVEALRARSAPLAPLGRRLRSLAGDGCLGVSVDSWTASLAHMHANRLLRSAARAQELVIHDLLERLYRGRLARFPARRTCSAEAERRGRE